MKKVLIVIGMISFSGSMLAQDFSKDMATAKSSYNSGKLEETHFALLQAMQEVDIIIGKEVLKLLPPKMDTLAVNTKEDQVSANAGFIGCTIHRSYGKMTKKADLSIISNSPLVAMLNSVMNTPLLGGMMNDGNSKTVSAGL